MRSLAGKAASLADYDDEHWRRNLVLMRDELSMLRYRAGHVEDSIRLVEQHLLHHHEL
jgi:hypothetical protein